MSQPHETIDLHAVPAEEVQSSLISPDLGMLILTWVIFFLLLGILYKFAWKPILTLLDAREESIRRSIAEAERIKEEMADIELTRKKLIEEASTKAKDIIVQSRKAAGEAAQVIEAKAREEARISLENALRDIREETQKAQVRLREEGAHMAITLAGKLIQENMDTAKNRKIIDCIIKDI